LIHAAFFAFALAQEPSMDAGSLAHALDRLGVTGRVLYVAAHPDDENTRLLAYLANARHLTAAYLSMTRGGGGQNLIGREQAQLLDVVRTEELLSARRIDGAQQRFTRMRDFGYSKTAEETFRIWGHDEALSDVVWVIRTFQPDVVITRFDENPPNHGHHTASAVLAREAVAAAEDPSRFPEQLGRGAAVWKVTRLLRNVGTFRGEPPPAGSFVLDVGGYDARLGMSYGELAARSRSQHKSQGFGVSGERGPINEAFLTVSGDPPKDDLLDGVALGWDRFGASGAAVGRALDEARAAFEVDRPERAVPGLVKAHRALDALPDGPRTRDARRRIEQTIAAASGMFVRATCDAPVVVPGGPAKVAIEVVMRRPAELRLERALLPGGSKLEVGEALAVLAKKQLTAEVAIPADAPISVPYWLAPSPVPGRNAVSDPKLIGEPKGLAPLPVVVELSASGRTIPVEVALAYAWTDPVEGERLRDVLVAPPATVTPAREAVMFPNDASRDVVVRVRASQDALEGDVVLPAPAGWRVEPAQAHVKLAKSGDEAAVRFAVTPAKGGAAATVAPALDVAGRRFSYREDVIDHPHIPMQVVLQPASVRLVPAALTLPKGAIGYVQGSGDTIPDDLADLGLSVALLDDETLRSGDLSRFHAIVVGIRAYNTRDVLKSAHERLMRYVEEGGTVVVQYNTQSRVGPLATPVGPYPLEIGRGRVTDENAAMKLLVPEHEAFTKPHKIGAADFDGWVQERGLYYAEKWDTRYTPLLAASDPGESPLEGALLFGRYGKGRYVYTGLAFFRQLPAGVPGAYRLFLDLIGP
jgi:LmbE family N-acetylglucosaminyl deacetylase